MEIINNLWWAVAALAGVLVVAVIHQGHRAKRLAAQYRQDESTLNHFVDDLDDTEIDEYKNLPSSQSRLKWLDRHHPEFMDAIERHYRTLPIENVVAVHFDLKILRGATRYETKSGAILSLRSLGSMKSLTDYQAIIDEHNANHEKWDSQLAKETAKHYGINRQKQEESVADLKAQMKAGQDYWNSLTFKQKENFKKARGVAARKKVMPATSAMHGYSIDTLYRAIMETHFSTISQTTSNSINQWESPRYNTYPEGGSAHYVDNSNTFKTLGGGYDSNGL